MKRLHSQVFFLYGVVVGLAIREALVRVGPDLVLFLSPKIQPRHLYLEALRLVVFFLAITTFYIGSNIFFDKVHLCDEAQRNFPKSNYAYDFWFGLIHFLLFFFCAIAINDSLRTRAGLSLFLIYLTFVFLYDMIWLFANRKQDSTEEIKTWAWVCSLVCLLSGCAFLLTKHVFGQTDGIAEAVSLAVFGAYLVIDLAELMFGSPIITKWILKHLIPRNMVPGTSTEGQTEV